MATTTRTRTRSKKPTPPAVPAAPAPVPPTPPDPLLDDLAVLLEQPEAFREWLQSRPPNEPLVLAGVTTQSFGNGSGYWDESLWHPVSFWLKAVGGRPIWCDPKSGQWRLLVSRAWRDQPDWLRRFRKQCDPGENDQLKLWMAQWKQAGEAPCPTPARVLQILEPILETASRAAE